MPIIPDMRDQAGDDINPADIDRWNWGAFLLGWVWGIGNNTFIALLNLVPILGTFIMPFVLGARGSRWAWTNGRWESFAHFKRVQRRWAMWGAAIWLAAIVMIAGFVATFIYTFAHSEAYKLGVARLNDNPAAFSVLGLPISTGFPMGTVSVNGSSGMATLNFAATGPKASGRVVVQAVKQNGVWSLRQLQLHVDGRTDTIDLLTDTRARNEGGRLLNVPG